ncbi:GntR family transcriptional regulator [Vreelandella olivaria]|uniref:GntR family transcriptional regulator n=1 Tax=Vreelandella olivaria TaxID=390919 RepID=A0ABN5WSN6_9GAMM|nr:GntR family transcriptional regulator [Halomonas olivaria]
MIQAAPKTKSERIARVLEAEIRSGSLHDGAALSSESSLVERFAVSRTTVRKGLGILVAKGLIRTRVGIGSFVTYGGAVIDNGPGWSLALSDTGTQMDARILQIVRQPMDLAVQQFTAEYVLAVDRIRFRKDTGRALTLERSRVPWRDDFAPILAEGLENGSLSQTLEARHLSPASGEEWANVLPALTPEDAALMGRAAGEPMLRLRRLTRTVSGDIVEYVESLLDPGLFGLHMEF